MADLAKAFGLQAPGERATPGGASEAAGGVRAHASPLTSASASGLASPVVSPALHSRALFRSTFGQPAQPGLLPTATSRAPSFLTLSPMGGSCGFLSGMGASWQPAEPGLHPPVASRAPSFLALAQMGGSSGFLSGLGASGQPSEPGLHPTVASRAPSFLALSPFAGGSSGCLAALSSSPFPSPARGTRRLLSGFPALTEVPGPLSAPSAPAVPASSSAEVRGSTGAVRSPNAREQRVPRELPFSSAGAVPPLATPGAVTNPAARAVCAGVGGGGGFAPLVGSSSVTAQELRGYREAQLARQSSEETVAATAGEGGARPGAAAAGPVLTALASMQLAGDRGPGGVTGQPGRTD
ncbi:hypothetical protein T492DRAFT_858653 [Pavlovales sp. CCMP2436]|nr:hypothetical protein T492DRAFT_858653 [Pavlovales sp. CCMP2436]